MQVQVQAQAKVQVQVQAVSGLNKTSHETQKLKLYRRSFCIPQH